MKKTLLLTVLVVMGILTSSYAMEKPLPVPAFREPLMDITTLVINAHVTVVLVEDNNEAVRLGGDDAFLMSVNLKQTGHKLVVDASKNRDMRNKGVVYIPASSLKYIEINSTASVRTENTLKVPVLSIKVNGSCKINIRTVGHLNIIEGTYHEVHYRERQASPPVTLITNEAE